MTTRPTTLQDQRLDSADQWNCAQRTSEPIIDSLALAGRRISMCTARKRSSQGFTLIELMLVMAVAGILSGVAYPSFMGQLQKIRRADALVALLQVQAAQERWRSNNPSYGSSVQLGLSATSSAGHYAIRIDAASELGYEVLAAAQGVQAHDAPCRYLRLRSDGGNLVQTSGADVDTSNPASANRQCWSM
jgi:type IV pilus assembly protein PilE